MKSGGKGKYNSCNRYTNCGLENPDIKKNGGKWDKIYNGGFKHNCYAYALDKYDDTTLTEYKPQMGYFGYPDKIQPSGLKSCSDLSHRVLIDNPHIYKLLNTNSNCREGYYKTSLFLAPDSDYHWYRQDDNGKYSHKPGLTEVTEFNNESKEITDPLRASRSRFSNKYQIMDYSMSCDSFCVPKKNTFVE
jgi:hypothetical protein